MSGTRYTLCRNAEPPREFLLRQAQDVHADDDSSFEVAQFSKGGVKEDTIFGIEGFWLGHRPSVERFEPERYGSFPRPSNGTNRRNEDAERYGKFVVARFTPEIPEESIVLMDEPPFEFAQASRYANGSLVISHMVHEFANDHDPCVGLERGRCALVETTRGLDEPDCCNLLEIATVEPRAPKLACASATKVPIFDDEAIVEHLLRRRSKMTIRYGRVERRRCLLQKGRFDHVRMLRWEVNKMLEVCRLSATNVTQIRPEA